MASVTFALDEYTGSDLKVGVTLTELADGSIQMDIGVMEGYSGDLQGIFFHINESLLGLLNITGSDMTGVPLMAANSVLDLGSGNNLNGEGQMGFDVGVTIGTSGIGGDDIRSTTLILSRTDGEALTIADLANANPAGDDIGIRVTSVDDNREGSSKLGGEIPLPPVLPPVLEDGIANTPGFWKQDHHFQYWSGYTPGDLFSATFGLHAFDLNPSRGASGVQDALLDALSAKGGGIFALARAGTAALLNAASDAAGSGINYVIDEDALAISVFEVGADLAAVMETLAIVDLNHDRVIGVTEVIHAVQDAFGTEYGGIAGPLTVNSLAVALDAMNNMPSLEVEQF